LSYGDNNYSKEYKKIEKSDIKRMVSDETKRRDGRRNREADKQKNPQDSHLGGEKKKATLGSGFSQ